jgi:hypothetical protein
MYKIRDHSLMHPTTFQAIHKDSHTTTTDIHYYILLRGNRMIDFHTEFPASSLFAFTTQQQQWGKRERP